MHSTARIEASSFRVVHRRNVFHAGYLQAGDIVQERYAGSPGMDDCSRNVMVVAGINQAFGAVAKTFGMPGAEGRDEVRSRWPVN